MREFESAVRKIRGEGQFFSHNTPVYISRAPGRLDLMGGNVDYTGGLVFQSTIREATWAAAQRRTDRQIILWNPQVREEGWRDRLTFDLDALSTEEAVRRFVNAAPEVHWTSYVLGVFFLLRQHYPDRACSGASVYIESDVPLNKGVSSSAAIEVAVMKAVAACHGVNLCGIELAEACQWVENVIADSACGIMDQAASVLGDEGQVLPLLCQSCVPQPMVKLPPGLRCWAIDSGVRHMVSGVEYEAARAAAFVGYRMICEWEDLPVRKDEGARIPRYADPRWQGFLSNVAPSQFRSKYEQRLPETMSGDEILSQGKGHPDPFTVIRSGVTYRVRACTRYAIEENQRIQLFVEMARGCQQHASMEAFRQMGELMLQSHWSYTECGLGCERTDQLVDLVRQYGGDGQLFGAKITGGGAGGTVAILGSEHGRDAFEEVVREYGKLCSFEPHVFEGSSMGADRFGIRVLQENA